MTKSFLALVLLALSAGTLAADDWTRSFQLTGTPRLSVKTNDAAVRIVSWDQNRIEAHVATEGWRIADDEVRVSQMQSGDSVTLDVHVPQNDWHFFSRPTGHREVRIELSIPAKADVDVRSGDGAVSIQGVEGTLALHTGDGSITAEQLRGDLKLSTGDGRIEGRRLNGKIQLNTADGAIQVREIEGEVELSSGDGRIQASEIRAALTAHTGDGSLDVDGRFNRLDLSSGDGAVTAIVREGSQMESGWRIHSNDGSVVVRLPEAFAAELDAHTGDGSVTLDLPVQVSGSVSRSRIRGMIHGGGQLLEVHTGDGSIHLQRL